MQLFRRTRGDDGAAAVEFALLLPIFIILTFGSLSVGLAIFQNISLTQGARDGARYGATLPITTASPAPAGEYSPADWLSNIMAVVAREAGWASADTTDVGGKDNGYGFICVAYVPGTNLPSGSLAAQRDTTGDTPNSKAFVLPGDDTCFDDGRTDTRVQVYVRRDGELNYILGGTYWNMSAKSSQTYERDIP